MLLRIRDRRRGATVLRLHRDTGISTSLLLRVDRRNRIIHGIKAPVVLRREPLWVEVDGVLQRIGIYPSTVPAAWRRGRTETRDHAVWYEVAVV